VALLLMTVPAGVRAACAGEAAQNVRRRYARFAEPQMGINLTSLIDSHLSEADLAREG
jgi:hypothetical protein